LDRDINKGYRSTQTHWPVGLGRQHSRKKHHTQRRQERQSATTTPATRPLISKYRKPLKRRQCRNGAGGQATPYCAGPNAAALLQPNRPTDDVKTTKSEGTHTRVHGTQPATQHASLSCAGISKPATRLALRTRLRDRRRSSAKRCPAPRSHNQPQATTVARNQDVASPHARRRHRSRRPKMSPAPSFDAHREVSAVLKTPP
jgi:hypothetical protein